MPGGESLANSWPFGENPAADFFSYHGNRDESATTGVPSRQDQATMNLTSTRLIEAYRAADLIEAHTIRIAMEDAGFQVVIDGEGLQGESIRWAGPRPHGF
jgi:hypothetical protein